MNGIDRKLAARFAGAAAAAWCLMLGPASNGIAAPAAPPPPKTSVLQPATPDDPAKVALARIFIPLYHPRIDMKNINAMIDRGMSRAIEAAKLRDPKLDARKFEQDTRARMIAAAMKSLDRQSHVVSRHFSQQELKDLIAFFRSPLGRKLAAETPKIQQEMLMASREERAAARARVKPVMDSPAKAPAKPPAQSHK